MYFSKVKNLLAITIMLLSIVASGQKKIKYGREHLDLLPPPPDYNLLTSWVGHPEKNDEADKVPGKNQLENKQNEALVDVFFVYPTIYSDKQLASNPWNADINDEKLNEEIASSTIKNQASVFNGSAKVYAPLYRQAHINVFKTDDLILRQTALDNAYEDVKAAFGYYMENYNAGRPIIIAAHSQGTLHAARLLNDYFEGKPLEDQLVAAYIIGMPLAVDLFDSILPCTNAEEFGCWVTWNTYAKGWYPESFQTRYQNALSVNPLNWRLDESYAPASKNMGGVLRKYSVIRPELNDAQNHKGVLWISKPKFFGNFLMRWKRYHVADYNLFYLNIRQNVADRVENYLSRK